VNDKTTGTMGVPDAGERGPNAENGNGPQLQGGYDIASGVGTVAKLREERAMQKENSSGGSQVVNQLRWETSKSLDSAR